MEKIVDATVTKIVNFGAFCDTKIDGKLYKGLIHISEIADTFVKNIEDYLTVGKEIKAFVISVDNENNKAKLSLKKIEK